jgi:predicted alpha/beta hydrolase family esterase
LNRNLINLLKYLFTWIKSSDKDKSIRIKTHGNVGTIDIYFVHGLADKSDTFNHLIHQIKERLPQSIRSVNAISLSGINNNIESFSKILTKKIVNNKHRNIILIGHSRGGIICSYVAEFLALPQNLKIHGVITIAAPFKGSQYAIYPLTTISASLNDMTSNSELLKVLYDKLNCNETNTKYCVLVADNDLLIEHYTFDRKCNVNFIKVIDSGHLTILYQLQTCDVILNFVKNY